MMYIRVAEDGELGLQESDNFRAFAIVRAGRAAPLARLAEIATAAEDDHYWLDADAVLELSGRKHDPQWVSDFRAMLETAAPYGYFETTSNRVKAHMETTYD
jgi:hypothetical protein